MNIWSLKKGRNTPGYKYRRNLPGWYKLRSLQSFTILNLYSCTGQECNEGEHYIDKGFIYPSSGQFIHIKMFSAVHELGHLIFHREQYLMGFNSFSHTYGKKRNINEEVANHFAMCFLVSRSLMKKYRNIFKNKDFLLREIMEIKSVFLVSAKCLIYALEYYGYITEKQKGTHIGYLNKNGYSTAEPRPMQSIEKGAYWQGVIRELFNREEISLSKISEVLEIPLSQARMLTREWYSQNESEAIL